MEKDRRREIFDYLNKKYPFILVEVDLLSVREKGCYVVDIYLSELDIEVQDRIFDGVYEYLYSTGEIFDINLY